MGLTATVVGAAYGVGVVCYANALRKAPLFRSEWNRARFTRARRMRACATRKVHSALASDHPAPEPGIAVVAETVHSLCAGPWEHVIFGVGGGFYFANQLLSWEKFYEELAHKMVKAKMDRNHGVLEDKYRAVLGSSYEKYYAEKS